jgi:nucleoside 2-deoxyribosyltransferase
MIQRIYLAGPIFSQAEIDWAGKVKASIQDALGQVKVIWPHEIASGSPEEIFLANTSALKSCELLVAILDGSQVDDGTSWEVGYHYSQGKPVLGIRTDFRNAGETSRSKINAMVEQSCLAIASNLEELISEIARLI